MIWIVAGSAFFIGMIVGGAISLSIINTATKALFIGKVSNW
jgi:hypothetical protein